MKHDWKFETEVINKKLREVLKTKHMVFFFFSFVLNRSISVADKVVM